MVTSIETMLFARERPVSRNGGVMRDCWTADRVSLLLQLWARGITAEAIGAQLGGLSRSAVLGKILRLRRVARSSAAAKMRPARRRRKQSVPRLNAPRSKPKRLLDLTNNCCRWIVEAAIKWAVTATLSHFQ
jgi:hypothetical protein